MNDRMKSTSIGAGAAGAFLKAYARDPEQADALAGAVLYYALTGEQPERELEKIDEMAWDMLSAEVDRIRETSARRAVSGRIGGSRPKANASKRKQTQAKQSNVKQEQANSSKTKQQQADIDIDIENKENIYIKERKPENGGSGVDDLFSETDSEKLPEIAQDASDASGTDNHTRETSGRSGAKEIGKESAVKASTRFSRPSVDEVRAYMAEIGATNFDPETFVDHYESNGWKVGKTGMKDWRASVRYWKRSSRRPSASAATSKTTTWKAPEEVSRRNAF